MSQTTSNQYPAASELAELRDPNFSDNATRVLAERYFARVADDMLEAPKQFLWRVANAVAQPERKYGADDAKVASVTNDFFEMMARRDFLPNTPCLINAGRPLSMLSACFVLPVPDDMAGIFDTIKAVALIQKAGGGTGMPFSDLRASGAHVVSTGKEASGPVSFMKVFDAATDSIKQGGVRRGANMGVLRIDHPDALAFMRCKKELDNENRALYNRLADTGQYTDDQLAVLKQELLQTQFKNFNISMGVTNEFMLAVLNNDQRFGQRDPRTKAIVSTIPASELFDALVEGAWLNGEPGIVFLDHPDVNPLPGLGAISATNPCGEQFLHAYDSCNLGSINLGNFYNSAKSEVDWDRLAHETKVAIRFLDNVIDANIYPLDEIRNMVTNNRRVGLGIMGFADLLIQMQIRYGSPEAIHFATKLMKFIQDNATDASEGLANERGDFPNKHLSNWANDSRKRRNAALLSIAPTGTISMLADCSFGCEPHFAIAYTKHVMKDKEGRAQELYYVMPQFAKAYEAHYGKPVGDDVLDAIAKNKGSLRGLGGTLVTYEMENAFVVTSDVTVEEHIDMLAAFQRHTCNAVSKTINAPNSATREDVAKAIHRAYSSGCKGFTFYRDGSRTEQVITFTKKDSDIVVEAETLPDKPVANMSIEALLAKAATVVGAP